MHIQKNPLKGSFISSSILTRDENNMYSEVKKTEIGVDESVNCSTISNEIDEDVELNNGSHEDLDLVPSETKKAKLEPNVDFGGSKSNNDHQINGMTGAGSSPGGINKLPPLPPLPPPISIFLRIYFLGVSFFTTTPFSTP